MFSTPFPSTLPTCLLTPSEADPPESPELVHDPLLHHDPPAADVSGTDGGIFWFHNVPLWRHGILGRGGFATVHKVEVLVSANSGPEFFRTVDVNAGDSTGEDEHSDAILQHFEDIMVKQRVEEQRTRGCSLPARGRAATDVLPAEQKCWEEVQSYTFPAPPSIPSTLTGAHSYDAAAAPPGAAVFPTKQKCLEKDQCGGTSGRSSSLPVDFIPPLHPTRSPVEGATRRLRYSGRFFALKIQTAENEQQMEHFAKEAEKLRKLRGRAQIVEIKGHMLLRESLEVAILMELAACDLGFFLQKTGAPTFPTISRVWCALVSAVDVAHREDIIHRDLKPQNFLLVPISTADADRVLAGTTNVAQFIGTGTGR